MQIETTQANPRSLPYIFMAFSICNRIFSSTQRENGKIFTKSCCAWLCFLIILALHAPEAAAQDEVPKLSVLPWQLIGLDNEFPTRHKKKLDELHKQLAGATLTNTQALDLWLEAKGRKLPYNLKRSLNRVLSGESTLATPGAAYIVPVLCRVNEHIVVATQLVDLSQNILLSSEQLFTPLKAWEGESPPLSLTSAWTQNLGSRIKGIDTEAEAFKIDLALRRGSNTSVVGSYECLNMLLAHELQKSLNVPTPLNLLEGYRLRQLLANSRPKKSTRTYSVDWGVNPKGPSYAASLNVSESVRGAGMERDLPVTFTVKPDENRMLVPDEFLQRLMASRSELLAKDYPQVAKVYRAWVYLDRGRAWGLEMNDRLYLNDNGRRVKGHVVGFYTNTEKLTSPRGFPIQEGAIVYVRKGQREVKVGDTFQFDPTAYPTPWPAVRQPSVEPTPVPR